MRLVPIVGFLLAMTALPAFGKIDLQSGPARTTLLELYTSEGCSSCPPAEARFSGLKDDPKLWKQFVPVAFHVDYWDRLGWRDRYSSRDFTARQSRYAALWQSESVYTPAFVLDGRELRDWSNPSSSPNETTGVLSATSNDGRSWSINFRPAAAGGDWEAHVALLGCGIASQIGAGENSGRKLQHDFVVLSLQQVALAKGAGSLTIPRPKETAARQAIAIWVTRRGQLPPVQATGGWL